MKKFIVVWQLFLVISLFAVEKKTDLHFVNCTDLKEFVKLHVPEEKQRGYLAYYQELNSRMKQADQTKRRKTFAHLQKTALQVIEKEHSDWHASIMTVFGNPLMTIHTDKNWEVVQKATDIFLTRYGAFHIFAGTLEKDTKKQEGFWGSLVNSFAGWFGPEKTKTI